MDLDRPYITKRPHKKSRNGCIECKRRKQKCDEIRPSCGSCTKRRVQCFYTPKPSDNPRKSSLCGERLIQETDSRSYGHEFDTTPSSPFDVEPSTHWNLDLFRTTSESLSSEEEAVKAKLELRWKRALTINGRPRSLQPMPWRNKLENELFDSFYRVHGANVSSPDMDAVTREIWLSMVPQIALNCNRTLFQLLCSLGAIHMAIRSPSYPDFKIGSEGARLWKISMHYFSEAISTFREKITSKKIYETNPEVFCVIAMVLSFRTGINAANQHHSTVESLYDDLLAWFSASLGYIALGGFYTKKLKGTRLGDIVAADPGATYSYKSFLEHVMEGNMSSFDYLHPMTDPVTAVIDPEDITEEALYTYTLSIKLLGWIYEAAIDGAAARDLYAMWQTIPYTTPPPFLHMLKQRRPRAVAILAHYMALSALSIGYEKMLFWPEENISLLQTLVPNDWSWAFAKAVILAQHAEGLRSVSGHIVLPNSRKAPQWLDNTQ